MGNYKTLESTEPAKRPGGKRTLRRRPSVKGELRSGLAKKRAVRDKVKNPRARKALSKRHPRTPENPFDRIRLH